MRQTTGKLGAYRLLTFLWHATPPLLLPQGDRVFSIPSMRRVARLLGTESRRVRRWLLLLEEQGYLTGLAFAPTGRTAAFRLVTPTNLGVSRVEA